MNSIESIIEELQDISKSLAGPLLKTKVLAKRIGNSELFKWADRELTGYRQEDEKIDIPKYRHCKPQFTCNISQGFNTMFNQPLPLLALQEEFRNKLLQHVLEDGIQTLEEKASGRTGDYLGKEYGLDMLGILNRLLNPGANIKIEYLSEKIHISEITQVLSVIRSKLLDFMLEVEAALPHLDEAMRKKIEVKKEDKRKIQRIIHQTIINAGDNNKITTGSDNNII